MIPLDRIEVLNPRERNQKKFDTIVHSIGVVGLKKPITVTPRSSEDGAERYMLICGEGRLKAYQRLGEARIPALVVSASDEDAYVMSLAENIARRRHRPLELLQGITLLKERGCSAGEIARRTGLNDSYVRSILELAEKGEERLMIAVERGQIPLTVAMVIVKAGDDDKAVQLAMQDAYEAGSLRGHQLMYVKKLVERRQFLGRSITRKSPDRKPVTSSSLVRAYQKEVERQRLMVRKSSLVQQRLFFILGALRKLIADENLVNVLRLEGLDTLPRYLADRVVRNGGAL
ncbi:plasmid partitioning protein RepB C-terminal domain-containing protein [Variovorax dokdonensis]|uniref:Plasmid partitioning protein RepB C-terminal domain-containing protein n=2 Tax=Variovorax dokdonensis TaxID=344883 RepID=A0ABT7NF31_9BURK|nr:plasmid partitioning protein RepB C-terminal domain-containing protein [Variovorax dokdonensis]MDM0046560.1 plasmid partitioning protein RepB C-terminal domain-containing protein [Variovorax dokdonensis]